jgi:hypothetical protein
MTRRIRSRVAALAAITAMAVIGGATLASGEVVSIPQGGGTVSFNGGISPRSLPRTGTAPVGVQMGGKIRSSDESNPPVLKKIFLNINRNGVLEPDGLPRCQLGKLKSISSAGAKRVCGASQVGQGSVTTRVSLPGQGPFASIGNLLAFNGRYKGRPAILAHVNSGPPLPLTYVIVFEVKKSHGTFGTKLIGTLPPIASEYGYITAFNLSLRRTYHNHGKRLSYASAGCPAPSGFSSVNFPMAKISYQFEDGRSITSTLVRKCNVRR